ncbi:NUDIX domain-containing protein [Actinophytocola xinjiangensis]|nr:NUDIX domain-containing protein [Actinophytocola xinjiangensis]
MARVIVPDRLRLVRGTLPAVDQQAVDRAWEQAVLADPTLYDGPALACPRVDHRPADSTLTLEWAPVTYRYFSLRRVPGADVAPALFAAVVQPTVEGGLVVGRTTAAGQVQIPGGVVEQPTGAVDEAWLAHEAARELAEETGVVVPPEELARFAVTSTPGGNVGVFFRAPPLAEKVIRERFAVLLAKETAAGNVPELAEVTTVGSLSDLLELGGPYSASSIPVARRYLDQFG